LDISPKNKLIALVGKDKADKWIMIAKLILKEGK
jgi:hypothetical protein